MLIVLLGVAQRSPDWVVVLQEALVRVSAMPNGHVVVFLGRGGDAYVSFISCVLGVGLGRARVGAQEAEEGKCPKELQKRQCQGLVSSAKNRGQNHICLVDLPSSWTSSVRAHLHLGPNEAEEQLLPLAAHVKPKNKPGTFHRLEQFVCETILTGSAVAICVRPRP